MSIELSQIYYRYSAHGPDVLSGANVTVQAGQMVGLTAPSGSGKSTLLKIAGLLLSPQCGTVTVAGHAVDKVRFGVDPVVRQRIGFVMQSPRAATNPRLTLAQIIAEPIAAARKSWKINPSAPELDIRALAETVHLTPDLLDRLPHQVSDGQLQRACLARALALGPSVLLCDEPTAMLDAPTTAVLMRTLSARAREGAAVLVASHDFPLLESVCDTIVGLFPGRSL